MGRYERNAKRVGLAGSLILIATVISGCSDLALNAHRGPAEWTGKTTAGANVEQCPAFEVEVAIDERQLHSSMIGDARIEGARREFAGDFFSTWWLTGMVFEDGVTRFTIREQKPYLFERRNAYLWHGSRMADGSILASEQSSPCERTVTLVRDEPS